MKNSQFILAAILVGFLFQVACAEKQPKKCSINPADWCKNIHEAKACKVFSIFKFEQS